MIDIIDWNDFEKSEILSVWIAFYLLNRKRQGKLIPCLFTSISFYLFARPNSRLYLSNPFSLSHSILCISTYICYYLFSIRLYFFISLSIQVDAYLFLSLCQSKFTAVSFKPVFFISLYFLYIHLYFFISLSIQIDAYFFISL